MKRNKILKVGDKVWFDGYTSMAQQNAGEEVIAEIKIKYDEDSGRPFNIYKVGNAWYDGRDGSCFSNKQSMYYIDLKYENKK